MYVSIKQVGATQAFAICLYITYLHYLKRCIEPMSSSLAQASKKALT